MLLLENSMMMQFLICRWLISKFVFIFPKQTQFLGERCLSRVSTIILAMKSMGCSFYFFSFGDYIFWYYNSEINKFLLTLVIFFLCNLQFLLKPFFCRLFCHYFPSIFAHIFAHHIFAHKNPDDKRYFYHFSLTIILILYICVCNTWIIF